MEVFVKRFIFFVNLFVLLQTGNFQKPPGQSLQDVLDMLTAQVSQLMNEARDNSARLTSMESQIQAIVASNYALENDNQAIAIRLGTIEANVNTNRGLINTLDSDMKNIIMPNINALKASVEKLDNVNKIWRNNFKIVNNTFTALRQKVNFRIPAIRLM